MAPLHGLEAFATEVLSAGLRDDDGETPVVRTPLGDVADQVSYVTDCVKDICLLMSACCKVSATYM